MECELRGRVVGEAESGGVGVAFEAFADAVRIAGERAAEVVERIVFGEGDGEGVLLRELAEGGRGEAGDAAEMVVENGERFEARVGGDGGDGRGGLNQKGAGAIETGASETGATDTGASCDSR